MLKRRPAIERFGRLHPPERKPLVSSPSGNRKRNYRGIPASWKRDNGGQLADAEAGSPLRSHGVSAGPNRSNQINWDATHEQEEPDQDLSPEERARRDLAARAALLSAPAVPGRRVQYSDPSVTGSAAPAQSSSGFWKGPRSKDSIKSMRNST